MKEGNTKKGWRAKSGRELSWAQTPRRVDYKRTARGLWQAAWRRWWTVGLESERLWQVSWRQWWWSTCSSASLHTSADCQRLNESCDSRMVLTMTMTMTVVLTAECSRLHEFTNCWQYLESTRTFYVSVWTFKVLPNFKIISNILDTNCFLWIKLITIKTLIFLDPKVCKIFSRFKIFSNFKITL